MTEPRRLTDKEVAALNEEHADLAAKVEAQCQEQIDFLFAQINDDDLLAFDYRERLLNTLLNGGFKVSMFRVTDANAANRLTVQVTYAIDDELEAYLRKPYNLPHRLRGFLDGGITLDINKATAEDKMPQTGKTKI